GSAGPEQGAGPHHHRRGHPRRSAQLGPARGPRAPLRPNRVGAADHMSTLARRTCPARPPGCLATQPGHLASWPPAPSRPNPNRRCPGDPLLQRRPRRVSWWSTSPLGTVALAGSLWLATAAARGMLGRVPAWLAGLLADAELVVSWRAAGHPCGRPYTSDASARMKSVPPPEKSSRKARYGPAGRATPASAGTPSPGYGRPNRGCRAEASHRRHAAWNSSVVTPGVGKLHQLGQGRHPPTCSSGRLVGWPSSAARSSANAS